MEGGQKVQTSSYKINICSKDITSNTMISMNIAAGCRWKFLRLVKNPHPNVEDVALIPDRQDPTCCGATKPAQTEKPKSHNKDVVPPKFFFN